MAISVKNINPDKLIATLQEKAPYLLKGLAIDGKSSNEFIEQALRRGYDPSLIEDTFSRNLLDFDVDGNLNNNLTKSLVPDAMYLTNETLKNDFIKPDYFPNSAIESANVFMSNGDLSNFVATDGMLRPHNNTALGKWYASQLQNQFKKSPYGYHYVLQDSDLPF